MGLTKQKRRKTKQEEIERLTEEIERLRREVTFQAEVTRTKTETLRAANTANRAVIYTLLKRNGGRIVIKNDEYAAAYVRIANASDIYTIHKAPSGASCVIELNKELDVALDEAAKAGEAADQTDGSDGKSGEKDAGE